MTGAECMEGGTQSATYQLPPSQNECPPQVDNQPSAARKDILCTTSSNGT